MRTWTLMAKQEIEWAEIAAMCLVGGTVLLAEALTAARVETLLLLLQAQSPDGMEFPAHLVFDVME